MMLAPLPRNLASPATRKTGCAKSRNRVNCNYSTSIGCVIIQMSIC
jgi:hypothetical protein